RRAMATLGAIVGGVAAGNRTVRRRAQTATRAARIRRPGAAAGPSDRSAGAAWPGRGGPRAGNDRTAEDIRARARRACKRPGPTAGADPGADAPVRPSLGAARSTR